MLLLFVSRFSRIVLCVFACSLICTVTSVFFFQAEDGIRDLVRSRGLGDVYKRQKLALERGLAAELTDHLGYEKGDPAGRALPNARNLSLIHI